MTRDEIIKALRCKASKAEQRNCDKCRREDGCTGCINEYIGAAAAMLEADARQEEPKTNADCVRAMSNEDLAAIIADNWCERACGNTSFAVCDSDCEEHILAWLRQPA